MTRYLQQRTLYPPQIQNKPSLNLGIITVIPAFDEPYLLLSLMSLKKCRLPHCDIEVIIVINESKNASEAVKERNIDLANQVREWMLKNNRPRMKFFVLQHSLPNKHAGVGLARKIGMDEACWRLEKVRNPQGIISCFDADSRCDENYFVALEQHFLTHPKAPACGIYFEHPLSGPDFEQANYEAITLYELHLRYYIQAQRYAGFPYAYQTIGSSMAVRCSAYQKQGGMNKRKAGEDFYFLHKFTPLPGFTEINSTRVIPSARPSHRVPFGTGKAVQEILRNKEPYLSYAPQSFEDLKQFFAQIPAFFEMDEEALSSIDSPILKAFLLEQSFSKKMREIKANSSSFRTFKDRFFRWFNAFMIMKYVHYARERGQVDIPVEEAAAWLLKKKKIDLPKPTAQNLLIAYRRLDRLEKPI